MDPETEPDLARAMVVMSRANQAHRRPRSADRLLEDAFEIHHADLYSFAVALLRDPETAQDVVGEAFAALVREVDADRTPNEVRGWLYSVVANRARSHGRRLRTARRYLIHLIDRREAESPESMFVRGEVEARLIDALQVLSPDARAAVVMAARGISGHDIAVAIGRSDAATRTLLCRARVRLRDLLHEEAEP